MLAVDTSSPLTHLALEFDQTHVLIGSGIANNAQVFDAVTDVKKKKRISSSELAKIEVLLLGSVDECDQFSARDISWNSQHG